MKYISTISLLLLALLFSGCMDTESPFGDPVDETDFLEQNALEDDVEVTDSGLQYRIIEEGEGDSPNSESVVFVEYVGTTISDETFMYSDGIDYFPISILNLEGLAEGIQMMNEGSRFEFFIPPELGYGDNPPTGGPLRPGSVLVFDMELDSFLQDPEEFLAENREREDITVTETGLQYRVIEEGSDNSPAEEDEVSVRYTGTFTNGYVFDESPDEDTVTFPVSGVIPGFSEALQLMGEGATYEIFVPADIGYGDNTPPAIPDGAILVFEIELDEIIPNEED